ncbi:TQO small subunit DoxD [Membranihabitans maritimus]|uniref:TQO small subunit DoxD n=1 Tax=Membranihabitans maritimus TaxID=2904244 RepID=UPI001F3317B3|nr:TQO small subunit DoxD [Membranihabitans maritimus]
MINYSKAENASIILRLIVGWTYFSALWRRVALSDKLDMESAGWIGIKFNYFLPNALGIKPIIEFLVENPDLLQVNMIAFTIIEGVVGLALMVGFMSRFMSLAASGLAFGILLGSGWLGSTCLDEWQIGVLGISGGLMLAILGPGRYSVDSLFLRSNNVFHRIDRFMWKMLSGKKVTIGLAGLAFFITLATNQIYHGGLWGPLHNLSKMPEIQVSEATLKGDDLTFGITRVEGIDVYGNFIVGIRISDDSGNEVVFENGELQRRLEIKNFRPAKIGFTPYAMTVELGSRGEVRIPDLDSIKGDNPQITLIDVNGKEWRFDVEKE